MLKLFHSSSLKRIWTSENCIIILYHWSKKLVVLFTFREILFVFLQNFWTSLPLSSIESTSAMKIFESSVMHIIYFYMQESMSCCMRSRFSGFCWISATDVKFPFPQTLYLRYRHEFKIFNKIWMYCSQIYSV